MAVLPDRFDDDERGGARDVAKNLHAVFLAVDEAVLLGGIERMGALYSVSGATDGCDDGCLDGFLSGPALLIGGQTQIAAGDEKDGFTHLSLLWHGCMLS